MIRRVVVVLAPTALVGALLFVPAMLEAACLPAEPVTFTPVPVNDPREAFALQSGASPDGDPMWSAVALRTAQTHVLTLFNRPSGGAQPTCFSLPLTADVSGGSTIALLVGRDSSRTLPGPFADVERIGAGTGGTLQFARAVEPIYAGAPPTSVSLEPADIVKLWRCPIRETGNYVVELESPTGVLRDVRVVNWSVPAGDWSALAPQSSESLGTAVGFPAVAGSEVLIAVVKSWTGGGSGTLTVRSPTVAVGDGVVPRTRLLGIAPNPSFGPARVSFETAEAGEATLRVVNVAGRMVAQERIAVGAAGSHSFALSRLAGGRAAAGLYFVSLGFAGRQVGTGRFIVLEGVR